MTAAVGFIICSKISALAAADPEPSVETGRKALGQWTRYPWYDSATDAAQPIDIMHPWDWSFLDLFSGFPSIGGQWIEVLGLGLLGVLLALLIYLMVRMILRRQPAEDADSQGLGELAEKLEDSRRFDALPSAAARRKSNLLEEARRHYRNGDYGEAIIYLFSYQLLQLDKHQLIRLARGKTNRQYVRELGPRVELGYLLTITMQAFEDVFFGNHSIDRVRFESCWLRLEEFESLADKAAG
jgi:hypothetical protein